MTTNQTAPVTDEELDQMIWKLERDGGMTPKMLSLMRELREVRRAKGEPVDQVLSSRVGNDTSTIDKALPDGMALYAAQPAPVVPDVISTDDIPYSVGRFRTHRDCYRDGWNACRAAMLQAGNSPATPDGWVPCGERIPEEDLKVLANVKSTSVEYQCLAEIDKNGRWWDEHDEQLPSPFITHWMPLPAAPKEVG